MRPRLLRLFDDICESAKKRLMERSRRQCFAVPFRIGDWVFATDGLIAVRTQAIDAEEFNVVPPADTLPWSAARGPAMRLPTQSALPRNRCWCNFCGAARGTDADVCKACRSDFIDGAVLEVVPSLCVAAAHARMLRRAGITEVAPVIPTEAAQPFRSAAFTAEGLDGLVIEKWLTVSHRMELADAGLLVKAARVSPEEN